jgi:hypothetical protein
VERSMSRRAAVAGVAAGAAVLGAATASPADAQESSMRGTWRITPKLPAGVPSFEALAAFGAGGVLVTTGSDEPGTGIGQWASTGTRGFEFAYTNFHFDSAGKLSSIVEVHATGKFKSGRLRGTAHLRRTDANGAAMGDEQVTDFTGRRMASH